MKTILRIIGAVLLLFAIGAGFGSARDWLVLKHFSGYEKDRFTITGTRAVLRTGDDGTDYYLQGRGQNGDYEFVISAARYEALSPATEVGRTITVFRNPSMPAVVIQKESANVIFEEDWRDLAEVAAGAKSTMWMGVAALVAGVAAFVFAGAVSRRGAGSESRLE